MSAAGAAVALELEVEQTLPMPLSGSLRCGPGELVALVGPSGAGKTSMMRVLAGLMRPERARVVVGQVLHREPVDLLHRVGKVGVYLEPLEIAHD